MTPQLPEVINGIRLQMVADTALGVCKNQVATDVGPDGLVFPPGCFDQKAFDGPTSAEKAIAKIAKNTLNKLRRKGYSREQCRLGFWNKIVSEAGKIDVKK